VRIPERGAKASAVTETVLLIRAELEGLNLRVALIWGVLGNNFVVYPPIFYTSAQAVPRSPVNNLPQLRYAPENSHKFVSQTYLCYGVRVVLSPG
jgi:hypothetical protein